MSEPIISVSGLRGTIGDQLTPEVAVRYTAALAATLERGGTVVIGRDGRSSGVMLAEAVSSCLKAHGLNVANIGCASTPTVGVEVRRLDAVAGIQISASHNPKEYNGLKLFGASGRVLPKLEGEAVLQSYRDGANQWVNVDGLGANISVDDPTAEHLKLVLATVDAELIRSKRFNVLLDSNHGAGALLGRRLLESLGCTLTVLGEEPHGRFWHTPEPIAENLTEVSERAIMEKCDVTFCQDPDADRLAIIDEQGKYIGEEMTLALCLLQALPKVQGTIVTNCATSGLSKAIAAQHDCRLLQSAVGEANVCDLMIAEQAVFGGEGNGGPIDPQVGYVRDSFVGMARVLELLATSSIPISEHVASLPPLAIVKDKLEMDTAGLPGLFETLTATMSEAQATQPDGLKLDWGDRWLLVRGSNTEPIVRFIAEAPTIAEAQSLCDEAKKVARDA